MKSTGSSEKNIYKNGDNVPHLEITEEVLVHSNVVNNYYHLDSRIWHIFVPNKLFGKLIIYFRTV